MKLEKNILSLNTEKSNDVNFDKIKEYEYQGKKYVRVQAIIDTKLSTGKKIKKGESIWIEVQPING